MCLNGGYAEFDVDGNYTKVDMTIETLGKHC